MVVGDEVSMGIVWALEVCTLHCAASGFGGTAGSQGRRGYKNRIYQDFPKWRSDIHCVLEIPKHSKSLSINDSFECHPLIPEFPWVVVVGRHP